MTNPDLSTYPIPAPQTGGAPCSALTPDRVDRLAGRAHAATILMLVATSAVALVAVILAPATFLPDQDGPRAVLTAALYVGTLWWLETAVRASFRQTLVIAKGREPWPRPAIPPRLGWLAFAFTAPLAPTLLEVILDNTFAPLHVTAIWTQLLVLESPVIGLALLVAALTHWVDRLHVRLEDEQERSAA